MVGLCCTCPNYVCSLPHSSGDKPGQLPALGTMQGEWHHPHGSSTGGACPWSTPLRQPPLKGREEAGNMWTVMRHLPGMGQGTSNWSLPSPAEPGSLPGALPRTRQGTCFPHWTCSVPPHPHLLHHPCGCHHAFQEHFSLKTEQGLNLALNLQWLMANRSISPNIIFQSPLNQILEKSPPYI